MLEPQFGPRLRFLQKKSQQIVPKIKSYAFGKRGWTWSAEVQLSTFEHKSCKGCQKTRTESKHPQWPEL